MSSSLTPEDITDSTFVCDCGSWAHHACPSEPFYKEFEGKSYCVLHYPDKEKSADFKEALQRKLDNKDFNFRGVWFPDQLSFIRFEFNQEADFSSAIFNEDANFNSAVFSTRAYFNNATFSTLVSFNSAAFSRVAYFSGATFYANVDFNFAVFTKGADFISTVFSKDAYFSGVSFSGEADFRAKADDAGFSVSANFRSATFGAKADFIYAKFEGADFGSATFTAEAHFSGAVFAAVADVSAVAYFTSVTFGARAEFNDVSFSAEAYFVSATFSKGVDFISTGFRGGAYFIETIFGAKANFSSATFYEKTVFTSATFKDYVTFAGNENRLIFGDRSSLDLQFARTENPDLISFHTLTLCPHWFVNIDPRKFDFTNVDWHWPYVDEEVKRLRTKGISHPNRLLAIVCRNLAINAEENHRYEEASKFRYMAMDSRRQEKWHGLAFWRLSWWYWLASGYGERAFRAAVVLIGVWLLFALLYTQIGFARWEPKRSNEKEAMTESRDEVGEPLELPRAFTYSLGVLTLQKPEPRPTTIAAQSLVILETILGPLQVALLALAIRRKFMR